MTVDAYGTLLQLRDPVPGLELALRRRGISLGAGRIRAAVEAEIAYYRGHALEGRDEASLARLHHECTAVFLEAAQLELDPGEFVKTYLASLEYELLPGVRAALSDLGARGLSLGVVSNWDASLPQTLERLGVAHLFAAITTSAEARVAKPDPAPFLLALWRLQVRPEHALHVGDGPEDRAGAAAAGLAFAPAPLPTVAAGLA